MTQKPHTRICDECQDQTERVLLDDGTGHRWVCIDCCRQIDTGGDQA